MPHDHDAIPPAVKPELVRRCEPASEAGVRVVDKDTVAVGDDPVRRKKEANGNGPAVGIAAGPTKNAVVGGEIDAADGLIAAVGTFWIDEGFEGVGLDDDGW